MEYIGGIQRYIRYSGIYRRDTEVYKDSVEFTGGIHRYINIEYSGIGGIQRYINIEYSGIGGIQSYIKIQWNL